MSDIEIINYLLSRKNTYEEITVNQVGEIIVHVRSGGGFFDMKLFEEIKQKIGKDFQLRNTQSSDDLTLIIRSQSLGADKVRKS